MLKKGYASGSIDPGKSVTVVLETRRNLSDRLRLPLSGGNARRARDREGRDPRPAGNPTGAMNPRSPAFWLGALAVAAVTACTNGGGLSSIGGGGGGSFAFAAALLVCDRPRHTDRKDRRRERSRLGYGRADTRNRRPRKCSRLLPAHKSRLSISRKPRRTRST